MCCQLLARAIVNPVVSNCIGRIASRKKRKDVLLRSISSFGSAKHVRHDERPPEPPERLLAFLEIRDRATRELSELGNGG